MSSVLLPSEVRNRQEWDSSSSSCAHICVGKGPGERHNSRAAAWAGLRSQWPWTAPLHPSLHDITVKCMHGGLALEKSLSFRGDTVWLLAAVFPLFAPRIKLNLVVTSCAHHDETLLSLLDPTGAPTHRLCTFICSGFPMELAITCSKARIVIWPATYQVPAKCQEAYSLSVVSKVFIAPLYIYYLPLPSPLLYWVKEEKEEEEPGRVARIFNPELEISEFKVRDLHSEFQASQR